MTNPQNIMNSLFVLKPYFDPDFEAWVFDDPERGLVKEPLVLGADLLCQMLYEKYGDFSACFSSDPIPESDLILHRTTEGSEQAGTWYSEEKTGMSAWLCPALFKYFEQAPDDIFVKANPTLKDNE